MEDQKRVIFEWIPAILNTAQKNPVKLVVIDSVAALLRLEGSVNDRSLLSYHLHQLAQQHNLIIMATNQVADVMENQKYHGQLQFLSSGRFVKPALGGCWTYGLSRRVFLTRGIPRRFPKISISNLGLDQSSPARRFMFVVGASYTPNRWTEFCIREEGVFGLSAESPSLQNNR
jgi:hypothetical protein